ncbi:hypothetical protein Z043_124088, partial [Scleropages formosus]
MAAAHRLAGEHLLVRPRALRCSGTLPSCGKGSVSVRGNASAETRKYGRAAPAAPQSPISAPPPWAECCGASCRMGTLVLELYWKHAPRTCKNFAELARRGYYNNTKFHRIIKDFMVQGGDPTGTG